MNAREFFFLVANMRDTQRRYFDTRDQSTLRAARALENDVDREIRRVRDILEHGDASQDIGPNGRQQIIEMAKAGDPKWIDFCKRYDWQYT